MKLSELVDYLNQLDQVNPDPTCAAAIKHLDGIMHTVTEHTHQSAEATGLLANSLVDIKSATCKFNQHLEQLRDQLRKDIAQHEQALYQESSRVYEQEMCFDTNEYILDRRLSVDHESNTQLQARIFLYTDWRLPGMIIRPGRESFVEDMVPLDPLYLVDHHQELLDPAILKFTVEYQRRLRPYIVKEYHENLILEKLPNNQFGFVLAFNYFNYKPIEIIKRYLTEVMTKLRPGGVFIMTYSDCDFAHAVALAEKNFMCYTPGSEIKRYAESIGYEILNQHKGQGDLCWFELKRPGEITSLRGGQTLAKIVPK
jgi:hypothetical protein